MEIEKSSRHFLGTKRRTHCASKARNRKKVLNNALEVCQQLVSLLKVLTQRKGKRCVRRQGKTLFSSLPLWSLVLFLHPDIQCTFDLAHSHTVLYISTVPPPTHYTHHKMFQCYLRCVWVFVMSFETFGMLIIDLVTFSFLSLKKYYIQYIIFKLRRQILTSYTCMGKF